MCSQLMTMMMSWWHWFTEVSGDPCPPCFCDRGTCRAGSALSRVYSRLARRGRSETWGWLGSHTFHRCLSHLETHTTDIFPFASPLLHFSFGHISTVYLPPTPTQFPPSCTHTLSHTHLHGVRQSHNSALWNVFLDCTCKTSLKPWLNTHTCCCTTVTCNTHESDTPTHRHTHTPENRQIIDQFPCESAET